MNKAYTFLNWDKEGNHYRKKANAPNKWTAFEESVINRLKSRFGKDFFLVIWTDSSNDDDFFKIPFRKVSHLFVEENKTTGKNPNRWTVTITDNQFQVNHAKLTIVDVGEDYFLEITTFGLAIFSFRRLLRVECCRKAQQ